MGNIVPLDGEKKQEIEGKFVWLLHLILSMVLQCVHLTKRLFSLILNVGKTPEIII